MLYFSYCTVQFTKVCSQNKLLFREANCNAISLEELKTVNKTTFVQVYVKVAHVVYFVHRLIFFFSNFSVLPFDEIKMNIYIYMYIK